MLICVVVVLGGGGNLLDNRPFKPLGQCAALLLVCLAALLDRSIRCNATNRLGSRIGPATCGFSFRGLLFKKTAYHEITATAVTSEDAIATGNCRHVNALDTRTIVNEEVS